MKKRKTKVGKRKVEERETDIYIYRSCIEREREKSEGGNDELPGVLITNNRATKKERKKTHNLR